MAADRVLNPGAGGNDQEANGPTARTRNGPEGTMARTTYQMLASRREAPGLAADIADLFRNLTKALLDPYRPELHYMRGPGPKWHARHDPVLAAPDSIVVPALIRVRVRG